jgi:hypothetical protein
MQELALDRNLYGKVTLLRGDPSLIKRLCISLAIKLQPLGQPLFIDAANSFDPYIIQRTCRKDARDVLNNILISRPFTLYQLKSLIYNLGELAQEHKVVIISSIDLLARDFQGKEKELALVLEQMLSQLQQVTREHGLITFAGCHDILPAGFIERYADYAYKV